MMAVDERPLRVQGEDADGQWSVVVMVPPFKVWGSEALLLIARTVIGCSRLGDGAQRAARVARRVNLACCQPVVPEHDVRRIVGYVYGGDRGWM